MSSIPIVSSRSSALFLRALLGAGAIVTLAGCPTTNDGTTTDGGAADTGAVNPGLDAGRDGSNPTGDDDAAIDAGTDAADAAPACTPHEPPTGFTAAVTPSTDGSLGLGTAVVADENDDPMIAYEWFGPGGVDEASAVYFTRWDRCAGAFTTPVKVDTVGITSTNEPTRRIDLAYDAAAKKLAIVYELVGKLDPNENPSNQIFLQTSTDGGATWGGRLHVSDQKAGDSQQATSPVVTMGGGKIQIAYAQTNRACCRTATPNCGSCASVWYLEGDGATFTRAQIVDPGGPVQPVTSMITMAADAAGKPAVAFFVEPDTGYNRALAFWRPGSTAPVNVMDSAGIQNDDPSVSLAFDGTKPRVVAHLFAAAAATYDMRVSTSDDGATWSAPIPLPRDGTQKTSWYESLSIDANGGAAVAAYINTGSGDNTCGGPRLDRSGNLTTWTACGADATKQYGGVTGKFVDGYFTRGSKLTLVSRGTLGDGTTGSGVLFWREP